MFCFMAIFVQPIQAPLEQPLRGCPTGPIYVTLVESTLFDGSPFLKTMVNEIDFSTQLTEGSDHLPPPPQKKTNCS